MKNLTIICLIMFVLFLTNVFGQEQLDKQMNSGDLIVEVVNLENDEGFVLIGLFNSKESWEGEVKKNRGSKLEIKDGKAKWIIKDIPFGEYAVRFYHDEDDDDEMDTNFLGMPSESFGFSNDAVPTFGIPDYEDAKFLFDTDDIVIQINSI